ncbi:hypothetical protein [Halorientalis salina]|uniref:hypothetical protein n=1 Tax=Halorientalis salina TaxID=2932266 RepID=UPI0010ABC907|nr:hypothetical protein [Halorientalis salina]
MDSRYGLFVLCLLGLGSFGFVAARSPATAIGPIRDHLLAVAAGGLLAIVCALGLTALWFVSWQRARQRE